MSLLYSKTTLGALTLQNHLVMSPMTRSRATGNIPNASDGGVLRPARFGRTDHYRRHLASPNGLGYPRIPGIFSEDRSPAGNWSPMRCMPGARKYSSSSCTAAASATRSIYPPARACSRPRRSPPPAICTPMQKA